MVAVAKGNSARGARYNSAVTYVDIMEKDITEINGEFVTVMKRLNKLYVEMPTTTKEAVDNANKALKEKKEYTFSDEEIDMLLPPMLQGKIKKRT